MSRSVSTQSLKERVETVDEDGGRSIKMRYTPRMKRNNSQKRSTKMEERIRWRKTQGTREKEVHRLHKLPHQDSLEETDTNENEYEEYCSLNWFKPTTRSTNSFLSMNDEDNYSGECVPNYVELAMVQKKLLHFRNRSADDLRTMSNVLDNMRKNEQSVNKTQRNSLISRRVSCSDLQSGSDRRWEQMVTQLYLKENTRDETLCVPEGVTIGATECLLPPFPMPLSGGGCKQQQLRTESLRCRRRSLTPDPTINCNNASSSFFTVPLASKWACTRRPARPALSGDTSTSSPSPPFQWGKMYHKRRASATPSIQLNPPSKDNTLLEAELEKERRQQKRSLPWLLTTSPGIHTRSRSPSPSVRSCALFRDFEEREKSTEKSEPFFTVGERRPSSSAAILMPSAQSGEMKRRMSNAIESLGRSLGRFKSRKSLDEAGKRELEKFARMRRQRRRSEGRNMTIWTGLPDDLASVLDGESQYGTLRMSSTERSPNAVRSPNGPEEYSFELRSLSLCSDLWDRFGLFDQEIHSAWHEKYSTEGMTSKQVKKQDAIFELILQERRHCAHLAFLKKGYRQRLVEEHVLNAADADKLIPDVLDAMLAFHLHLLDRLVERQRISKKVDTVADIIAEELGDGGRFTTRAVDAYTSFGAAKESAEAYYTQLLNKGGRFAGFYNKLQADPNYRRYAYKTLLTVIIGRPTKYLLMLDQIVKNEDNQKIGEQTKEAAEAARKFAARIDYGLQVCQMSKKWEEIKGQFEPSSKTMLHTGDGSIIPFTMDDLRKDTFENDSRKILCMGDVMAKSMSVYLILFDDILVVLQRKGGRMAFIQHEQAVLPVYSLHIRSTERQNSAFVISSCKPALLQFDFLNRNDRLKWVKVFETAIARAPKQVRMTPRSQSDSKQQARERAMENERMKRMEDEWLRKLEAIFDDRKPDEAALASYFGSRQKWFDHLRRHVGEMPYRSKAEIPDKVRQTVRARFREIRAVRVIPLAEMVERCTAAREGDLWAFFDDKHEMAAGPSDDSDSSGSGKSGKQPRRIQTFHGITSETREKSSIRRHTTVPKMSGCGSAVSSDGLHRIRTDSDSETEDESDNERKQTAEEREERIRIKSMYRVPLSLPLRARKATSRLVDDVVQLRLENNLLRNQAALDKMRLAFLERQRSPGYSAIVAPTETMEALRRKEQEIREEEIRVRESEDYYKTQLAQKERELIVQKERLAEQEADLERKWLAYKEHTSTPSRSSSQKENGAPCEESRRDKRVERTASTCSELSPTLKGLSVKSETRRKK
ncbi:hypothetical protein PRIPAC_83782 [Pristionchus pacificus]|nr:hypothetical protein PRIPAC_83782 [Pristionchus pacificus]